MKILKNCIKLSCQVRIYVPSTIEVSQISNNDEWIEITMKFLSAHFGGATSSKSLGAWITAQGNLVKENVSIVFSYARQDQLEDSIDLIYEFCLKMKRELKQEAIALEINNDLYLI